MEAFEHWDPCPDTFEWDLGYMSLVQSRMKLDPELIWQKIAPCLHRLSSEKLQAAEASEQLLKQLSMLPEGGNGSSLVQAHELQPSASQGQLAEKLPFDVHDQHSEAQQQQQQQRHIHQPTGLASALPADEVMPTGQKQLEGHADSAANLEQEQQQIRDQHELSMEDAQVAEQALLYTEQHGVDSSDLPAASTGELQLSAGRTAKSGDMPNAEVPAVHAVDQHQDVPTHASQQQQQQQQQQQEAADPGVKDLLPAPGSSQQSSQQRPAGAGSLVLSGQLHEHHIVELAAALEASSPQDNDQQGDHAGLHGTTPASDVHTSKAAPASHSTPAQAASLDTSADQAASVSLAAPQHRRHHASVEPGRHSSHAQAAHSQEALRAADSGSTVTRHSHQRRLQTR